MIARMMKFAAAGLIGVAAVAAPIASSPALAYSFEWDEAVSSGAPPGDATCTYNDASYVCFEPYGDKIYVYDLLGDYRSAVARWYTDYGRWGTCRNALGHDHWGVCNKNFAEYHTFYFRASTYDGDTGQYGPTSEESVLEIAHT